MVKAWADTEGKLNYVQILSKIECENQRKYNIEGGSAI